MAGQTLDIEDFLTVDNLAKQISANFITWENMSREFRSRQTELRKYIYATDTSETTNSHLPWKNKTTIPKLCQIRDNLFANYMAALFPKRNWLIWEGNDERSDVRAKREAIQAYMNYVVSQPQVKEVFEKLVLDYIDCGNVFPTREWVDERVEQPDGDQVGYVGPVPRRISSFDIVFNPIAPSFERSPKIVRSLMTMGEVKAYLDKLSTTEDDEVYQELYNYLTDIRTRISGSEGHIKEKDEFLRQDGFDSFRSYLSSGFVELLTFYGDLFNEETGELLKNHIIVIADRHKIISKRPNPSDFGTPAIRHCGWRPRQDNLWAMGPLDNLVGMQYRIDHLENLKADCFDLIAFPVVKHRGYVEDYNWGPFERIVVGDDGDVEIMSPDAQALNADLGINILEQKMEEMAGAPKEAMGFRTPGEKTMYEVQRLENAAARIFYNKILQFETYVLEPLLNDLLELARRNMDSSQLIRVFDDDLKIATFLTVTPEDISGNGRIRPVGAKHFAERAELIQNITQTMSIIASSNPAILQHFSTIKLAKMFEEIMDIEKYNLVQPYIALSEQADAQRQMNSLSEQVAMEAETPSGLTPDDADEDFQSA